ncbi:MAG: geranylgeranyl reductase family protein [Gammaproteobacteria bacterium]
MITTEVIIVGGGPAGSSCAARLREHGVDCLVLDREPFPRLKLCAGWITPEVVRDLRMDPAHYPHSFLTFETTVVHLYGLTFRLKAPQHSIRRIEFDNWLLERAGVPVEVHDVRRIEHTGGYYQIDDRFRARYLVGAGGTRCPVFRHLFREHNPRAKRLQALALETEFPCHWEDGDCHLWFFRRGLPGYSWYVPKANGYLNIGIGGIAEQLKQRHDDIKSHWQPFLKTLKRKGLLRSDPPPPGGYSYYLRASVDTARVGNAFVIGDAAGLATRDLCEGIGPAIRSGYAAADSIALGQEYDLSSISRLSLENNPMGRFLEKRFCRQ